MARGIPGVARLSIGGEDGFAGSVSSWYDLEAFDYQRTNYARDFVTFDDAVRGDLGPAGGMAGLCRQAELKIKTWAHGSGENIEAEPDPLDSHLKPLYGAFGMRESSSRGAATGVSGAHQGPASVVRVAQSQPAQFVQGGMMLFTDEANVRGLAAVLLIAQDGDDTVLTLDRRLDQVYGMGAVTGLYGGRHFTLNTADPSVFATDSGLATLSVQQVDRNGFMKERFLGCVGTELSLSADKNQRVMLEAGFKAHKGESLAAAAGAAAFSRPVYLLASGLTVVADGAPLARVSEAALCVKFTPAFVQDQCGDQGRSGCIITKVEPTVKLVGLNTDTFAAFVSCFEGGSPMGLGIAFCGGPNPQPGRSLGLYLPAVQVIDPYEVKDDKLQLRSVTLSALAAGPGNLVVSYC